MNTRLLEIIKNPDLLVINDIEILEKEISRQPYVQSYRALYLLSVHRFSENQYAEKLSETAAYTTDKKILYHLIHKKNIVSEPVVEVQEALHKPNTENEFPLEAETVEENDSKSKVEKLISLPVDTFLEVKAELPGLPPKVYTEGELNRILFEGEEDFLNEESEEIDLEATKEAGTLIIASKDNSSGEFASGLSQDNEEVQSSEDLNISANIEKEEVIQEEIADNELQTVEEIVLAESPSINNLLADTEEKDLETKFEESQSFSSDSIETTDTVSQNIETMEKFTPEVMVDEDEIETKQDLVENPSQLSFHGSQEFLSEVKMEIKYEKNPLITPPNKTSKHEDEMQRLIAEVEAKMKKASAERNVEVEEIQEKTEVIDFAQEFKSESLESKPDTIDNSATEDIKEADNRVVEIKDDLEINQAEETVESNIPVFINTWQSWLQLNPEVAPAKENEKQKAIEVFLEKEPKISRLKEESSFSVKDKGDNIAHLMTETLANLYLDQRLYAKANRAFELLIDKHPERADRFSAKLLEIKELRSQKL